MIGDRERYGRWVCSADVRMRRLAARGWPGANVELRLSRAPYRFRDQRPADTRGNALPFEARPGLALHLMFGVRSRAQAPASVPATD